MKLNQIWDGIHWAGAGIGAALGYFLGGFDGALIVLIVFSSLDYVTGVAAAAVKKELSSETGARGIVKKVLIFCLIGVGHMLDLHILGGGSALRTALIFWYIGNEGVSLLENASVLGVPMPDILKQALIQIRNKGEKK
jgi:toxin secretion/phage lysis holin